MKQDERHHTSDDIFVGIDLATRQHQVVVLDAQGCRLTSFKVPHSRAGLRELVERCTSRRVRREGRVHFAFEATGHVWEAVGAFLAQHALRYHVVNPLATFRVREARQMGRDKRDLTDAEQIAQLLRTGVVTQCQLLPANYMQLRRAWGEYHRLRRERARLKTLLVHQLYGVFPELVGEVAHGHGSGMPRGVEGGLASSTNCRPDEARFYTSRAGAPARTADVALQD